MENNTQISRLLTPEEQEDRFQKALEHYRQFKDKKSLDEIWLRVYEACKANASNICKGIYNSTFHDRLMDAVETVMRYIVTEGKNPVSLITYCYLPTFGKLCGLKQQREDNEGSYEFYNEQGYQAAVNEVGEIIEDYGIKPREEVRGICNKELMNTDD